MLLSHVTGLLQNMKCFTDQVLHLQIRPLSYLLWHAGSQPSLADALAKMAAFTPQCEVERERLKAIRLKRENAFEGIHVSLHVSISGFLAEECPNVNLNKWAMHDCQM